MECIEEVESLPSTMRVKLDMCQFGMVSHFTSKDGPLGPVKKPTGMLTKSWCLQLELAKTCPGNHEHVHLLGGRASAAQEYPKQLCEAICRGLAAQKKADLSYRFTTVPMGNSSVSSFLSLCCETTLSDSNQVNSDNGVDAGKHILEQVAESRGGDRGVCAGKVIEDVVEEVGRGYSSDRRTSSLTRATTAELGNWPSFLKVPVGDFPAHWGDGVHDDDGHGLRDGPKDNRGELSLRGELSALMMQCGVEYVTDDVSGAHLDPKLVSEARKVEMQFFEDMKVYDRVDRNEMIQRGGKSIKTRWIDVNKGDATKPNYRSGLVGKEYNTYVDDSLYASTPPLEALRLIPSSSSNRAPSSNPRAR